uniref:DNA mismatch repair protein n=1 Tax=Cacopsylla melanoneura TaxID=428564 RepID=A0A8D8TRG5_9HEMI
MSSKKPVTPGSTPTLFNYFKKVAPPQCPSPNEPPESPKSSKTTESNKKQPLTSKKSPNNQSKSPQRKSPRKQSSATVSPEAKENKVKQSPKSKNKTSPKVKEVTPAKEKESKNAKETEEEPDSPLIKRARRSKQRTRVAIESDSEPDDMFADNGSEDEYVPPSANPVESESDHSSGEEDTIETPVSSEAEVTPVKNGNKRGPPSKSTQPTKRPKMTAPPTPSFPVPDTPDPSPTSGVDGVQDWPHKHYKFLQPEHIMDADRKRPDDPNYNSKTVYVPQEFMKKQTPCMTQWWTIKAQNMDCVLFFKVGKFYELFHMDAVIGADELACSYMNKSEHAHSGFPEISYGKFAQTLVEKGYKVARVEQTESAEQMDIRCKRDKLPQKQRAVRREICKITCRGAQTFSIMDVDANYVDNKFLLSVTKEGCRLGICFVDTTIGEFHVGEFDDDKQFSRLSTMMSHYPPCRILLEKSLWSDTEMRVFLTVVRMSDIEFLTGKKELLTEDKLLSALTQQEHEAAKSLLNGDLRQDKSSSSRLDLKSFASLYWFLKRCLISEQLVTLGKFKQYIPVDQEIVKNGEENLYQYPKYMILDSTALSNLHVLVNSDNTIEGTLLEQVDHCVTNFGKRMLRSQLVKPLTNVEAIKQRQEAISVMLEEKDCTEMMRAKLKDLKDVERMLPRIYSLTSAAIPENHPESRATLYEAKVYSKKKIEVFTSALRDLKAGMNIVELLQETGVTNKSSLLTQLCNYESQPQPGLFPDMNQLLKYFENAFDHKEASTAGNIIPQAGVDPEYDQVIADMKSVEKDLTNYLRSQSAHFGCNAVYNESQKKQKKYVVEIPSNRWAKATSTHQRVATKKKNVENYVTDDLKTLQEDLEKAEARKVTILSNMADRILSKFCENFEIWNTAVHCLGYLDFLGSLAEYCAKERNVCIPKFLSPGESNPYIAATESLYPCTTGDQTYIPNSIVIGRCKEELEEGKEDRKPSVLLLTGPNMGGKSTVMRQIGLTVILAQMGCRVPADSLTLSCVDRIFTRMGAQDNLSGAQSTYLAELTESQSIMKHATKYSLALVDELGRGTGTNDGSVIARVTLERFLEIGCLTVFATHYHSVARTLLDDPRVAFEYMSYIEDKRNNDIDTIVFLYKLVPGICPKSFGFNVGELAGIPDNMVAFGTDVAFQIEARHNLRQLFIHEFASQLKHPDNVDVEMLTQALQRLATFECHMKKDLQDLPGGQKAQELDWWPSPANDPCNAKINDNVPMEVSA